MQVCCISLNLFPEDIMFFFERIWLSLHPSCLPLSPEAKEVIFPGLALHLQPGDFFKYPEHFLFLFNVLCHDYIAKLMVHVSPAYMFSGIH